MNARKGRRCALAMVLLMAGCATPGTPVVPILLLAVNAAVSKSSPAQPGIGAQVGVPVASFGPASAVAIGSYEYSSWDGGHDDVFSVGMQFRGRVGTSSTGVILGGEAVYHRWICKSDASAGCGDSPAANGLGLNGVVLKPLAGDRVRLWASAGPKWLTDFTSDGELAFESGFGWHAKAGVELPLGSR